MVRLSLCLALAVGLGCIVAASSSAPLETCDLSAWTFQAFDGHGTGARVKRPEGAGDCDGVIMRAADAAGMAGSFRSPKFNVTASRRLTASWMLRTEGLVPIAGGLGHGAPALTGGVYVHYFDFEGDNGAWHPQMGKLAAADTGGQWVKVETEFVVPSTARTVQVHLAFAAHTMTYSPDRMTGGRAVGQAEIANVSIVDAGAAAALPSTITVPDATLQASLDQAFLCLHNSRLPGNFTVGAGYTISGNISPDLTFGLHGVRRTGHPSYVAQMQAQWGWHAVDASSGEYVVGRVMGQVNWPLGVDQLFSFTGDISFLRSMLPLVDKSLAFVATHADTNGLVTLVEKGQGHVGGGADWVDWYRTRLDGKSFQFHMWYVRALRRTAALHAEFASSSIGNTSLADEYTRRADALVSTLRRIFWLGDHWLTNVDYADEGTWLDDSVWSIYHEIATPPQVRALWEAIDKDGSNISEAVPIQWTAFPTAHGKCSWFGRLGAGDIMARAASGNLEHAVELLSRFAKTVVKGQNIYEGYDMNGCGLEKCGCTTAGRGDYLEHCGGLIWASVEGLFGINFDSSFGSNEEDRFVARIRPRFPETWPNASMVTHLRGLELHVAWEAPNALFLSAQVPSKSAVYPAERTLLLDTMVNAQSLPVRVEGCRNFADGRIVVLEAGAPSSRVICDISASS